MLYRQLASFFTLLFLSLLFFASPVDLILIGRRWSNIPWMDVDGSLGGEGLVGCEAD